jgi:hypothetical protein
MLCGVASALDYQNNTVLYPQDEAQITFNPAGASPLVFLTSTTPTLKNITVGYMLPAASIWGRQYLAWGLEFNLSASLPCNATITNISFNFSSSYQSSIVAGDSFQMQNMTNKTGGVFSDISAQGFATDCFLTDIPNLFYPNASLFTPYAGTSSVFNNMSTEHGFIWGEDVGITWWAGMDYNDIQGRWFKEMNPSITFLGGHANDLGGNSIWEALINASRNEPKYNFALNMFPAGALGTNQSFNTMLNTTCPQKPCLIFNYTFNKSVIASTNFTNGSVLPENSIRNFHLTNPYGDQIKYRIRLFDVSTSTYSNLTGTKLTPWNASSLGYNNTINITFTGLTSGHSYNMWVEEAGNLSAIVYRFTYADLPNVTLFDVTQYLYPQDEVIVGADDLAGTNPSVLSSHRSSATNFSLSSFSGNNLLYGNDVSYFGAEWNLSTLPCNATINNVTFVFCSDYSTLCSGYYSFYNVTKGIFSERTAADLFDSFWIAPQHLVAYQFHATFYPLGEMRKFYNLTSSRDNNGTLDGGGGGLPESMYWGAWLANGTALQWNITKMLGNASRDYPNYLFQMSMMSMNTFNVHNQTIVTNNSNIYLNPHFELNYTYNISIINSTSFTNNTNVPNGQNFTFNLSNAKYDRIKYRLHLFDVNTSTYYNLTGMTLTSWSGNGYNYTLDYSFDTLIPYHHYMFWFEIPGNTSITYFYFMGIPCYDVLSAGYPHLSTNDTLPTTVVAFNASALSTISWVWLNSTTGTWDQYATNTSTGEDYYYQTFVNATQATTGYTWGIRINNSIGYAWYGNYSFTTFICSPPTNPTVTANSTSNLNLTWTNYTVPAGYWGNVTTLVRYSTTDYPTFTTGTLLYNGTNRCANIWLPTNNVLYYFSLWTYYEHYGILTVSTSYATTSGGAYGGTYNISIRVEDDHSFWNPANMEQLYNSSVYVRNRDGDLLGSSFGKFFWNWSLGYPRFNITVTSYPDIFYLYWNNSAVYRAFCPMDTTNKAVDFFITSETINPLYYGTINYSLYMFTYTLSFDDQTPSNLWFNDNTTRILIYDNNIYSNGSTLVDQDFLSGSNQITTFLHYGSVYAYGVRSNTYYIPFVGYFGPLDITSSITGLVLPSPTSYSYNINSLATFSVWNNSNSIWVNYTDFSASTTNATITFYLVNGSLRTFAYSVNFSSNNYKFQWFTAMGANLSQSYDIKISINNSFFSTTQYLYGGYIPAFMSGKFYADWINGMFVQILGVCPMTPLSWTTMVTLFIFVFLLVSMGAIFAEFGVMIASGVVILIQGSLIYYTSASDIASSSTFVSICVLLIILAVFSLKNKGSR